MITSFLKCSFFDVPIQKYLNPHLFGSSVVVPKISMAKRKQLYEQEALLLDNALSGVARDDEIIARIFAVKLSRHGERASERVYNSLFEREEEGTTHLILILTWNGLA